jgi:hypothetical protein
MMSAAAVAMLILASCSTDEAKRISVNQVKDISGIWNDTDSRMVSEKMVRDSLFAG